MSLSGQWIAPYSGTNRGTVVVDIDDMGSYYQGVGSVWDSNGELPNSLVRFTTRDKAEQQTFAGVPIIALDRAGDILAPDALARFRTAGGVFPNSADVALSLQEDGLKIEWTTSVRTSGSCLAPISKTRAAVRSEIEPMPVGTWNEFKTIVNGLEPRRFIFRGHEDNRWRLRSSFFRTGRANLERYANLDVADLQRIFSGLTRTSYNLNDRLYYAAFLNLAQHHGFPTPLLDWTRSPYVAAFFAFRNLGRRETSATKVRIYKLDILAWAADNPLYPKVFTSPPHLSIVDALAFDNPRAIPQQSTSTISSVDDIEDFVRGVESEKQKRYLEVIDLDVGDRELVKRELALMGITAGSLFPGLDGACEALREQNFGY